MLQRTPENKSTASHSISSPQKVRGKVLIPFNTKSTVKRPGSALDNSDAFSVFQTRIQAKVMQYVLSDAFLTLLTQSMAPACTFCVLQVFS